MGDADIIWDLVGSQLHDPGILRIASHVDVHGDGAVTVRGVLLLRESAGADRIVPYFPVSDPAPQASCADIDGDGIAGLTSFRATYKSKNGTSLLILITPRIEADERGMHTAELEIRGAGRAPIIVPVTLQLRL